MTQFIKGKWNTGLGPIIGNTTVPGFCLGWVIDVATGNLWKMPAVVTMENIAYNPDAGIPIMIATLDDIQPEARKYLIPVTE
jgi:hypothetical protein